jgi:chorismate synthase
MWGKSITISLFGESHGEAVGINITGLPSGIKLDLDFINEEMKRRAPGKSNLSTSRKEMDTPEILSGYFEGYTTGTPLCAIIRNRDTHSKDYDDLKNLMRPGHADYTGVMRYNGFNDYRGGGHFSGRLTAPLVFAGAICKQILAESDIVIGAHIKSIKDVEDATFDDMNLSSDLFENLRTSQLPLIDKSKETLMRQAILDAKLEGDSVGGVIECAILGICAGIGEPFFDSVESTLAHLAFSVPAVKGIEFGLGFNMTKLYGSEANGALYYEGDMIKTKTNYNGGILGGITTGMPIIFRCAIKPTASILKEQETVNLSEKKEATLRIKGRHDPCIVQRALPVIEAIAAIGMLDLIKRTQCQSV